ncbi:hypothetical protein VTN31DRAFT_882 [Thermomyces dupontii]|uniref:uncharacterized protein n=1 Tax=Talaromyces thermophilus TaxID=28565 RepID=UPI003743B308
MGFAAILRAWLAVLHGKEKEVPAFVGFDTDPMLSVLEKQPPPRFVLADKILRGVPRLVFGIRARFQMFWYKSEDRVLFLPAERLQQMRQDALGELTAQNPDANEKPFISENDLLSAWWARILMRTVRPSADRTLAILNAFDCRGILAQMGLIASPDAGLVTNCVNGCWTVVSARQVLEEPLSSLALQVRRSLEQQRTVEQVRASLAEMKNAYDRTSFPIIVGDSGMKLLSISSWQRARFFTLDFSPAVIKVGTPLEKRDNQLGRASYISCAMGTSGVPVANGGLVIGKDATGNWWFSFRLRSGYWAGVEQQLRKM